MVKNRVAVVFGSPEDIGKSLSYNDTHVTIRGAPNVTVQKRLVWPIDEDIYTKDKIVRITWKSQNRQRPSTVIEPFLCSGLNMYSNAKTELTENYVENPAYKSLHLEEFKVPELVAGSDLVHWRPKECDYDIKVEDNEVQVVEYCSLGDDQEIHVGPTDVMDKVEVGLFAVDSADDEDVNLSGMRCTWNSTDGRIQRCQKTIIFYNPAHVHLTNHNWSDTHIHLATPVGLHPKISVNLLSYDPQESCKYYMYAQLPLEVFVDKFQSSPVLLFGEHDLELPSYRLAGDKWGSEVLFELEPQVTNEIVLHSRYIEPTPEGGYSTAQFEPIVFLACDTSSEKVVKNPFYSKSLGYEALFSPDTVFKHIGSKTVKIPLPTPSTDGYNIVQYTTLAVLIFSMIYIFGKLTGSKVPREQIDKKPETLK